MSASRIWFGIALAACLMVVGVRPSSAGELQVFPPQIELTDAHARRQLVVSLDQSDVTRQAVYSSSDPKIARVDNRGFVTPMSVGSTEIVIRHQANETRIPLRVAALNDTRQIDFSNEIEPLLSRYGCNAGGCHGKASGQNGFKLSLFGFDTAFDYQALVQEARGRRISATAPDRSLFLRKAAGQVPHGGGRRIEPGTEAYHLIQRWIEQRTPRAS